MDNPEPTSEFLIQAVVAKVNVSFLTTLDNEVAMRCSVEYMSKAGKTGDYMTEKFKSEAKTIQICQECLFQANTVEHIVSIDPKGCDCFCKECWDNETVCNDCTVLGQVFYFPACRACAKCLENGQLCILGFHVTS